MDSQLYATNMDVRRSKSLNSLKKLRSSIATSKKIIDETKELSLTDLRYILEVFLHSESNQLIS